MIFPRILRKRCSQGYRYASTFIHADPSKTRNMALVAHIDSGKTTLTESILLKSEYLSESGSVDTGSTTTDFLPAERERGITIQSASIPVRWKDWSFNLIDTPGHADFGMEVESASRVVDGAVVLIDSVEGVEPQTKGVWRQLDRYGVPTRLMFLNKLDRPGASFRSSLLSLLAHRFHPSPMALALPIASFDPEAYLRGEPGVEGLVDLVKWELWKWDTEGKATRHALPRKVEELSNSEILPPSHPLTPHLVPARTSLLENLSMHSDELMESLLSLDSDPSAYLTVEPSFVMPHLRRAVLQNKILPVLCGSAIKNIGTELVMDYVGELFANPLDFKIKSESPDGPLRLLAWKVVWDKRRGWMTFVRVYSGTLKRQANLYNPTQNVKEKASKLLLLFADNAEEVDELPFGSVGVILGLRHTRTGDTLLSTHGSSSSRNDEPSDTLTRREIVPPPSVMSASIIPQSHADTGPVQEALLALARTDPSVRVDLQESQTLIHGLGALHLEIVEGRLRDEFQANFEFGRRRVAFKEGLGPSLEGSEVSDSWETEVFGKPVTIRIVFEVRPLEEGEIGDPVWDGNIVVDQKGKPLPLTDSHSQSNPLPNIARGIASALSISPHTSLPISGTYVKIRSLHLPSMQIPPSILTGAGATILRSHLRAAGMGSLMEPYITLNVNVNEDNLGRVIKDLTEHEAEVSDLGSGMVADENESEPYGTDGVYVPPDWLSPSSTTSGTSVHAPKRKQNVKAVAPLSRMLDYSTRLRALSAGHGTFEMSPAGFRTVSELRKLEILREIGLSA